MNPEQPSPSRPLDDTQPASLEPGYSFGFLETPPVDIRNDAPAADGPFVLRKLIGAGGQGEVWEAWQSSLRREVAVKIHRRGGVAPFLHEAFTTAELDHPNIVPVFDLGALAPERMGGPAQPGLAMAMKRVRGGAWNDLIDHDHDIGWNAEALARHLRVFTDVCQALAYAHARGIAHLDLKPSQVIVGEFGEVYLMDWGMAARFEHRDGSPLRHVSDTALALGTPAYMAPEQALADGDAIGARTDVYLLGGMLFQIVSGNPPHHGEKGDDPLAPARVNRLAPLPDDAPEALRDLIARCLATSPLDRPASVQAVRESIEKFLGEVESRREGEALFADARMNEVRLGVMGYEELDELEAALHRARVLNPGLAAAIALRDKTLMRHVELAIGRGDLELARLRARSIDAPTPRAAALQLADRALKARQDALAQRRRARRQIFALLLTLVVVLSISAAMLLRSYEATERALEQTQREFYRSGIQAALSHAKDGNYAEARRLLESMPAELRRWEWGYLLSMATPERFLLAPRSERFYAVVASHDRSTIAALGSERTTITLFEASTGRSLRSIPLGAKWPWVSVVAGRDGKFIATTANGEVIAFDETTQQWLQQGAESFSGPLLDDPSTGGLLAMDQSGTLLRIRPDGNITPIEVDGDAEITAFDVSPDGARLAVGLWDGRVLWRDIDATEWTIGAETHSDPVRRVSWSPDGGTLVSFDGRILAWRLNDTKPVANLQWEGESIVATAWTPDSRTLIVAASGTLLRFVDARNWTSTSGMQHAAGLPDRVEVTDDGTRLIVSSRRDITVYRLDKQDYERNFRAAPRQLDGWAVTDDGIVVSDRDGGLAMWSWTGDEHLPSTISYPDRVVSLDIARDAGTVVLGHQSGTINVYDASTAELRLLQTFWNGGELAQVRTSTDGERLITGSPRGTVTLVRPIGGREGVRTGNGISAVNAVAIGMGQDFAYGGSMLHFQPGEDEVNDPFNATSALVYSHDGATLFAARRFDLSTDPIANGIEAIDLTAMGRTLFAGTHRADVARLNLTLDGKRLLSASDDETAMLWNTETMSLEREFRGSHAGRVTSAVMTPDGDRVLTACIDGGVHIFDRHTGDEILVLREHRYGVADMVMEPGGRWLYTVGLDGLVRVWVPLPWSEATPLPLTPNDPPSAFATARRAWK